MKEGLLKLALKWVIARLSEPSTWAGIGALFAAHGLSQDSTQSVTAAAVAATGAVAVILKDKGVL